MRRLASAIGLCGAAVLAVVGLHAQARSGEWMAAGGDPQRTAWVRSDRRLTKDAVQQGEFQFLWKSKFENESMHQHSLTEPILLDLLIGYRGFKTLGFVGGTGDRVFAIDTDLARPYWTTHLTYAVATGGRPPSTPTCPGGLLATPSRRMTLAPATFRAFAGGGGRSVSAVGEAGRGAAVLSQLRRQPAAAPPPRPAAPRDPAVPRPAAAGVLAPTPFGGVEPLYVMGSDGLLRTLRVSDGAQVGAPVPFIPPSAKPSALTFLDGIVYTTTSDGCGAAENGVWAVDLTADNKVMTWRSGSANVAGRAGPTFAADGTLYVATTRPARGAEQFANAVVALDRTTLEVKDWLATEGADFNAAPVVFKHKERELVAVSGNDGRLYLLDAASLGGTDHRTPLQVSTKYTTPHHGGLATWEDDDSTRWILASAAGEVVAFKVVDDGGRPTLTLAWRTRALASPLAPLVVNGMVFAVSNDRPRGSVLYVFDATTGKQMWSSGLAITSPARASLAAGSGQIYLVTQDNHLYAFGIPMEH